MKAERRHELQTNELAEFISQGFVKHREHLTTALWGVAAIVAIVMAFTVWNSRHGSSQAQAWDDFDKVRYVDAKSRQKRLKELAERYANHEVALWVRLDLADELCYEGREKMPLDREIASTYLKEAQQNYALILQNPKARPEMIRRAVLAEAKCWELLGDRDKAITSFQAAAEKYKNSMPQIAADAARYASELAQPEAADFYKWLAEYKAPTAPTLNTPGFGPSFPPLDTDQSKSKDKGTSLPPAEPTEESKSNGDESKPTTESTQPDDSSAAPPAAGNPPPKDEQRDESAKPQ